MFPLNLLLIAQLLCCYDLWAALHIDSHGPFGKGLFPLLSHRGIEKMRIDQRHLRSQMCHPFLNVDQTHTSIDQFNCFGVPERMIFEMENISRLIFNLTLLSKSIDRCTDSSGVEWATFAQARNRWEQIFKGMVLFRKILYDILALRCDSCCNFIRNRHFVVKHFCLLNVSFQPPAACRVLQAGIMT